MWARLKQSTSSKPQFGNALAHGSGEEAAARHISMARPNVVDEEYDKALHEKSFVDMYSRVHDQLNLKRSRNLEQAPEEEEDDDERKKKTELIKHDYHYYDDGIPAFHHEPTQESLLSSTSRMLLLEFFDTTLQASTACASLLSSIDSARSHHRSIHRLLHNLSSASSPSTFSALSSLLELENPLCPQNLSHFHLIHSRFPSLTHRLNGTYRKIARRLKLIKLIRRGSGMSLVTFLGAAVMAASVIALHGAVEAADAAPVAAAGDSCRFRRRGRWCKGWLRLERAKAWVDAAAKGAYIVGMDLDTMSQMLSRVHDEVEHGRDIARMVVMNRGWEAVMREVVKEMEGRRGEVGLGFEEQLEELEEHVYLCLITINRSRRLVAREMTELQEASAVT